MITEFAEKMLEEYTQQFPEKGDSYKGMEIIELVNLMTTKFEDILELDLENINDLVKLIRKCTHIGNYCAMISDNAQKIIEGE